LGERDLRLGERDLRLGERDLRLRDLNDIGNGNGNHSTTADE
jgi:hypothetical protein